MLHHHVECPHCGNEIIVTNEKQNQKCCWCRRFVSVKFSVRKGKKRRKIICDVEAIFPNDKIKN